MKRDYAPILLTNRDASPMVRTVDLAKSFGDLVVLNGVNITVERGEIFAIIGPSGSGKSTLLRCLNFLEEPTSGEVYIDGKLLGYEWRDGRMFRASEKAINHARAEIGFVFQEFNVWPHMTALGNIIEAPIRVKHLSKQMAIDLAMDLLDRVNLLDKIHEYPEKLSGGQKQRVAIARALAMQPKLMLLDEVTSALDPELVGEVLEVIRDLAGEGMTMIIVSHEMSFVEEIADRVCFIDGGKVHEMGETQHLLRNPQRERTKQFLLNVVNK